MKLSPLQWLFVTAVIVVVAVAASPTADTPPAAAAAAAAAVKAEDDDDDESIFPFKALQLYNTVAGYLEYIFDIVIAPLTGKYIIMVVTCR